MLVDDDLLKFSDAASTMFFCIDEPDLSTATSCRRNRNNKITGQLARKHGSIRACSMNRTEIAMKPIDHRQRESHQLVHLKDFAHKTSSLHLLPGICASLLEAFTDQKTIVPSLISNNLDIVESFAYHSSSRNESIDSLFSKDVFLCEASRSLVQDECRRTIGRVYGRIVPMGFHRLHAWNSAHSRVSDSISTNRSSMTDGNN